jgi:hypothetical protein
MNGYNLRDCQEEAMNSRYCHFPNIREASIDIVTLRISLFLVGLMTILFFFFAAFARGQGTQSSQKQQLEPEPGRLVDIILVEEVDGMTEITGRIQSVDSEFITLSLVEDDRLKEIKLPRASIQSLKISRPPGQKTDSIQIIGVLVGLAGIIGVILIAHFRKSSEERRRLRERNLRNPNRMALVGGMIGMVVGLILIIIIGLIFGDVLHEWGLGLLGSDAAIPLSFVVCLICIWFFAARFRTRAMRKR